jgi:hypothetical protein
VCQLCRIGRPVTPTCLGCVPALSDWPARMIG